MQARLPSTTLFIDDDAIFADGAAAQFAALGYGAVGRHPANVSAGDVSAAVLAVVDEYLEDWKRPEASAAAAPADGLSVGAVLRSQKPSLCVAILTGDLNRLADGVPASFGEHHIAALRDVEWVFAKQDPRYTERLTMLADAVQGLPEAAVNPETLTSWLCLPSEVWSNDATEHLTRCQPPLAPRQLVTGGRPLLRWLLQRVLPYPTFLLNDSRAAMALGVNRSDLDASSKAPALEACRYGGPLSMFLGRRWWRAGIDCLIGEPSALPSLVRQPASRAALVMPLGDQLEELTPAPIADCVRIYPDGWPGFADQAWALRADISVGSIQSSMLGLTDPLWSDP